MCGEVHFVGVRAGGHVHLIQACKAELKGWVGGDDRRCTMSISSSPLKIENSVINVHNNILSWYACLHVLFTHSDSFTTLWWISLKAVAVIGPW